MEKEGAKMTKHTDEMNALPDWAGFIIGQALAEFDGTNKQDIIDKVKSTAVGGFGNTSINKKIWKKFLDAMDLKEEYLKKKKAFYK